MSDILERLQTALEGTYAIESPLGEGGMALVFLARDLKHDRLVAVKVLRPELAASLGAERFLREIQITAKLSHPHILPLYDSGDADGLLFYVMPFVEGESLADYVTREKQLALDEALRITREVAEALGHAHSYGLIHRDIKPENVMMMGGHAIVADFGIAKAISDAGGSEMTQTGTAIGTPAYMSPEQAAGQADLDGRTDLYALGCMLYEMLVGQVPFTGPTAQAVIARHTMDQIPPPSIMRQSISPELEDIVFCAMAKNPADRFRTAQEMIDAIKTVETGGMPKVRSTQTRLRAIPEPKKPSWMRVVVPAASALGAIVVGLAAWQVFFTQRGPRAVNVEGGLDPRRVAVLYFEDLSPGGQLADVADGITDGLIAQLSTVGALDVVSRNGVASFRDPAIPRDSIGRALRAGSLVAGSVEQRGDNVTVSARLLDGETGSDLDMRMSVTMPTANVLAAQDSVVRTVASFLRTRLGEEIRTRELRAGTRSADAWRLVQRAERLRREASDRVGAGEREAAVPLLGEADSLLALAESADPSWPRPILDRGWVAYLWGRQVERGVQGTPRTEAALAHAERALALAPGDAEALELRGTVRFRLWQLRVTTDPAALQTLLRRAADDLDAAVAADPSLARAQVTRSFLFYELEDVPSALMAARQGYEADAYLENADDLLDRQFWSSLDLESFTEARRWCDEGARRFPGDYRFARCRLWLMATPALPPDVGLAWRLLATIDSATTDRFLQVQTAYVVGGVVARAGLVDSARNVLERVRSQVSAEFDPDMELISLEAYLRTLTDDPADLDVAIDLLKRVAAANPTHDWEESAGTWWWRDIRNHPRFGELLGR